jgi:hypothetical protein
LPSILTTVPLSRSPFFRETCSAFNNAAVHNNTSRTYAVVFDITNLSLGIGAGRGWWPAFSRSGWSGLAGIDTDAHLLFIELKNKSGGELALALRVQRLYLCELRLQSRRTQHGTNGTQGYSTARLFSEGQSYREIADELGRSKIGLHSPNRRTKKVKQL